MPNLSSSSDDDSSDDASPHNSLVSTVWLDNPSKSLPSGQTTASDSDSDEEDKELSYPSRTGLTEQSSRKRHNVDFDDPQKKKFKKNDSHYNKPDSFSKSFQRDNRRQMGNYHKESKDDGSKYGTQNVSDYYNKEGSSLDKPIQNDNKGRHMMVLMGYQPGEGLGKHKQGRVDPVELSKQKGRRGLGLSIPNLDVAVTNWKPELEVIEVIEEVNWLQFPNRNQTIDLETLRSWKIVGKKNLNIDEMTDFCNPEVLQHILRNKTVFDNLENNELLDARKRSNPFETIGKGIFLNRAAMKMANMDARFDFMFTNPKDEYDLPMVNEDELLYFADVCAGPGGFSEYVLWRKKWRAKGFGFTLKGANDFNLVDFHAGPCETFDPYYGVNDDGNVFDPKNIESLTELVMKATDNYGVHFMMADGGFSVKGQENIQELLSKQLYLAQFLVALSIVRTGGHFVCKVFDLFSPFSAGLLYLMYRSFVQICIFKPNTSRPANSERYIICKWKRNDTDDIRQYMFELNETLFETPSTSDDDITHCVPMSELELNREFYDYLLESNNRLGERQVVNLAKISAFYNDTTLTEVPRQSSMHSNCLNAWNIPQSLRKADRSIPDDAVNKILYRLHPCKGIFEKVKEGRKQRTRLIPDNLNSSFEYIYSWKYVVLGCPEEPYFYLGLGRNKVYRWSHVRKYWENCNYQNIELSPGTIVYGEIVQELIGEQKTQKKINVLHIFDAVALGYEDISGKKYEERIKCCLLYAAALHKYSSNTTSVRVMNGLGLEHINVLFENLTVRYSKLNSEQLVVEADDFSYQPKGVLFFKTIKWPWIVAKSRTTKRLYCFNTHNGESKYEEEPPDAIANIKDSFEELRIWMWEEGVGIHKEKPQPGVVHMNQILTLLRNKIPHK